MSKILFLKFCVLTIIITSVIWMLFKIEYIYLRHYLVKQAQIVSEIEENIESNIIEEGYASYYTVKSCKKAGSSGVWTASGERYDEKLFTCARPFKRDFGKYFKVTNIISGKSVIVKCNDLGITRKFNEKRVVDLSPIAFKSIGDLKEGLIKVKVEEL